MVSCVNWPPRAEPEGATTRDHTTCSTHHLVGDCNANKHRLKGNKTVPITNIMWNYPDASELHVSSKTDSIIP